MRTAVIYARSAADNEQSIEMQITLCKQFAKEKGLTVINIYKDNQASGLTLENPAFQVMNEQMNSWDILIVLRYDRITRNSNKRIDYLQKLKAANKEIFSVTEPEINGSYFDMFNALNEHYRGRK